MNRLSPIFAIGLLFLGGTALAQSFEPPSIPDLSGILDHAFSQIDPPSLQIDVGPSDDDIAEAQEAIASGIFEALNPDIFDDADPGFALLDILAVIEEAVDAGLQQGRVLLDFDFGP